MVKALSILIALSLLFGGTGSACGQLKDNLILARGGGGADPVLDILTGRFRKSSKKPEEQKDDAVSKTGNGDNHQTDSKEPAEPCRDAQGGEQ